MWEDPIVAEVRRVRAELEAEANGDLHEMFRRAVAFQKEYETRRDEATMHAVEVQTEYASKFDGALVCATEEGMQSGRASREEVFTILEEDLKND
jgi:hypothetical protein